MKTRKLHPGKIQQAGMVLALLMLCALQGCKFYYKVQSVPEVTSRHIINFDSLDKYIILHQRADAWHLSNPRVVADTLYGELSALPENRYKYLTTKPTGGNRYIKNRQSDEVYVLEEVHLYVADRVVPFEYRGGNIKTAMSRILYAEAYVKAKGRTTASWVIPAVGGTILTGGVVGAIAVAVALSSMHIHISMK